MKLSSPPVLLRTSWDTLHRVPGGKRAFSKMVGRMAPYTGTIDATVVELRRGYARAELADRKAVRNHLGSVHAIALANFGEVVSGVGMLYSLPSGMRGILTGLDVAYLKKARGLLTATVTFEPITARERQQATFEVEIRDPAEQLCCVVRPQWLLGPEG